MKSVTETKNFYLIWRTKARADVESAFHQRENVCRGERRVAGGGASQSSAATPHAPAARSKGRHSPSPLAHYHSITDAQIYSAWNLPSELERQLYESHANSQLWVLYTSDTKNASYISLWNGYNGHYSIELALNVFQLDKRCLYFDIRCDETLD